MRRELIPLRGNVQGWYGDLREGAGGFPSSLVEEGLDCDFVLPWRTGSIGELLCDFMEGDDLRQAYDGTCWVVFRFFEVLGEDRDVDWIF